MNVLQNATPHLLRDKPQISQYTPHHQDRLVKTTYPDRPTQTEFKMKLLTNECVAKSYTLFIAQ